LDGVLDLLQTSAEELPLELFGASVAIKVLGIIMKPLSTFRADLADQS